MWHASPDRHNKLRPVSTIGKQDYSYQGLYFSPSFRSLIDDWVPYIRGKKQRKNKNDPNHAYKTIFIHKVSIPKWTLDESIQKMDQVYNIEKSRGTASIGFWAWGEQVFIPDYLLKHVELIDIKKYTYEELMDLHSGIIKRRREYFTTINDPDRMMVPSTTTREDIIKQRKDEEKLRSKITVKDEMKRRNQNGDVK